MTNTKLIVFGAGENSTVVRELASALQYEIFKYVDPSIKDRDDVIGSLEELVGREDYMYTISIGNNTIREEVFESIKSVIPVELFATLIHPSAVISSSSTVGFGSILMANSFVGPESNIGKFTFINTGAQLDHHNQVGDFVHVAPKVVTGGGVSIGSRSFIGMSASISDHCTVGDSSIVSAMSFVSTNVSKNSKVFGIPARSKEAD